MGTNDKYRIFLIFLDFIFIDLLEWMVSKCQEERPGLFVPRGGKRAISIDSGLHPCALGAVL